MQVLGIKLAPLNIPLRRRLQTLAAAAGFATMLFGGLIGAIFLAYVIFYTHHWPEALLYLFWIYKVDTETCEQGGRRSEWVRSWAWWQYLKEYFPIRLERAAWVELDPKRNYLFCCFPHGILPVGLFSAFGSNWSYFRDLFPHHTPHLLTLKQIFFFPVLRDLVLAVGMCCASKKSLNYLLGFAGGGKVAALVVGGVMETLYCQPGQYRLFLKKRKGFVRLALQNGTPLVPVFSFGETDLYSQVANPEGSLLRRFQEWAKNITGIAPLFLIGRGFFQYTFGLIPQRKPVSTIVGQPIEVQKNPNPSNAEIDALHEKFVKELTRLFEEQKYNYLKNPEDTTLFIE